MGGILAILAAVQAWADPIAKISKAIADTKIAAHQATTDQEKVRAEERAKGLEAKRDVLVASAANSKWDAIMRFVLALPVAGFLWKAIIWDKVLALGSTDDLSENLWYVTMLVVGFYYVHWTVGAWKR
jgi:hypothetical protein